MVWDSTYEVANAKEGERRQETGAHYYNYQEKPDEGGKEDSTLPFSQKEMTNRGNEGTVVPHLYVDTNVFARTLEGRHRPSVHLLERIKERKWKCSTSVFTLMELSEIEKQHGYVFKKLGDRVPIRQILRDVQDKDLLPDELKARQEAIDVLFGEAYKFVQFYSLEKAGWDRAMALCASTNITPGDCIHVATAMEAGCDLLVTLDSFLKRQAQVHIPCCEPQEVHKKLIELGFQI